MKKLLLALAFLFAPSLAFAQCTGVFPANTVCGNLTGVPAPPAAVSASTSIFGPGSSTVGHFATWANTTGNQLADFDLYGSANTWTAANVFNTTATFGATVKLTGTSAGTQTKCLGLDSSNNIVTSSGACAAVIPVTTQSGDYTIQTTDCNSIVELTGAYKSITLPAAAGFASSCVVYLKNTSTTRAQKMIGFPADLITFTQCGTSNFCLWPLQLVAVNIASSAWQTFINPGRWRHTGASFFANVSLGSNNNDCLAAGSGGACATIQQGINLICYGLDSAGTPAQVNVADGTGYAPFQLVEDCLGSNQISVLGNSGTPTNVQVTDGGVAQPIIYSKDKGILTIGGLRLSSTVSASTGVSCGQNAILDVSNVVFNGFTGGSMIAATDSCEISLSSTISIVDNSGGGGSDAAAFINSSQFGRVSLGVNVTATGTWNFSSFGCVATAMGLINMGGFSFSGGTITGVRYLSQLNSVIYGTAANCPGSSAGSTATGGQAQ